LAGLDRLHRARPELHSIAMLYAELITTLFSSCPPSIQIQSTPDEIAEQWAAGTPLFRLEAPGIDPRLVLDNWCTVCRVLARHRDPSEPDRLQRAACSGILSPAGMLLVTFRQGPNEYLEWLARKGFDGALGASVLRFTALPLLAPYTASVQSLWRRGCWPHGFCFVCGSWPLLAETRGLEQFRWLRCGLCSAGWQVDRLFCPFCQSRDHRSLHEFCVEGDEQKHRLTVCDACRGFLRTVSTLTELSVPGLLVSELETIHWEFVAAERGYSIPHRAGNAG
jgi:FdhE protein